MSPVGVNRTIHELGVILRQAREKRGLSQVSAAQLAGLSEGWLYKVENGKADPLLGNLLKLSSVLGRDLAELLSASQRRVTDGAATGKLETEEPGDTRRRTFLGYLLAAGDAAMLAELGDRLYVAEMTRVSDTLMTSWYTTTPRSLLGVVTGHLSALQVLLPGPPDLRTELASTTGRVALLRGHVFIKLHRTGQAYADLAVAETLAREAGDNGLRALILAIRSGMFSPVSLGARDGDSTRALAELDEAARCAEPAAPPLLLVLIHARRAEERAAVGDKVGAQRDLEQVENALSRASAQSESFFGPRNSVELGAVRGFILTLLGQHDDAVDVLGATLTEMDPSLLAWRAAVLADQGAALAQQAEVEEACARLHRALDLAEQGSAADHVHRVVGVRRFHLTAHDSHPAVRQLDDRLGLLS